MVTFILQLLDPLEEEIWVIGLVLLGLQWITACFA